jgi:AcrR family transcriptional regulator
MVPDALLPDQSQRRYHHGSLRAALIDAAAQLVSERGPAGISLREVAARAGVSPAAPYHYFPDKSALLAAVAEEGFRLFESAQASALRHAPDDPPARLAASVMFYVRFGLDRPHYFRVMFSPQLAARGRYPALAEVAGRTFERLASEVRAARLACGHDDEEPSAVATAMWAVPHGCVMLYIDGPLATTTSPRELEAIARVAITALVQAPLAELELEREREPHWGV